MEFVDTHVCLFTTPWDKLKLGGGGAGRKKEKKKEKQISDPITMQQNKFMTHVKSKDCNKMLKAVLLSIIIIISRKKYCHISCGDNT